MDDLHKHEAYLDLTPKARQVVDLFLEHGDKLKAYETVYGKKAKRPFYASQSFFARQNIKNCIARYQGASEEQMFREELLRAAHSRKTTPSQMAALRMLGQIKGYIKLGRPPKGEDEPESKPESKGEKIIERDGRRYRIVDLGPVEPK
jgi:hypothetical protein